MATKVRTIQQRRLIGKVILYAILILLSIVFIAPFVWMIITSLKTQQEIYRFPPTLIPRELCLENYKLAVTEMPFMRYFMNTAIITILVMVGIVSSSSIVAYSMSKINWRGKKYIFPIIIGTMMIPSQVTMIPLYIIYSKLHMVGTILPLTLPYFFGGGAYYIFLLRQFMVGIPNELLEAGMVDGVGPVRGFVHVILPVCKPILGAAAALSFADCWNMVEQPLIYLANHTSLQPLSVMFNQISTDRADVAFAGSALYILPTLLIYLYFQEDIVAGIQLSELK